MACDLIPWLICWRQILFWSKPKHLHNAAGKKDSDRSVKPFLLYYLSFTKHRRLSFLKRTVRHLVFTCLAMHPRVLYLPHGRSADICPPPPLFGRVGNSVWLASWRVSAWAPSASRWPASRCPSSPSEPGSSPHSSRSAASSAWPGQLLLGYRGLARRRGAFGEVSYASSCSFCFLPQVFKCSATTIIVLPRYHFFSLMYLCNPKSAKCRLLPFLSEFSPPHLSAHHVDRSDVCLSVCVCFSLQFLAAVGPVGAPEARVLAGPAAVHLGLPVVAGGHAVLLAAPAQHAADGGLRRLPAAGARLVRGQLHPRWPARPAVLLLAVLLGRTHHGLPDTARVSACRARSAPDAPRRGFGDVGCVFVFFFWGGGASRVGWWFSSSSDSVASPVCGYCYRRRHGLTFNHRRTGAGVRLHCGASRAALARPWGRIDAAMII